MLKDVEVGHCERALGMDSRLLFWGIGNIWPCSGPCGLGEHQLTPAVSSSLESRRNHLGKLLGSRGSGDWKLV